MPETRLRASALLCKAFMHFEVRESQANADIRILWIQILDLLDRLMNIDKGDQLVSFLSFVTVLLSNLIPAVRGRSGVPEKRRPCYACRPNPGTATGRGRRHARRQAANAVDRNQRAGGAVLTRFHRISNTPGVMIPC
jgi:hypothetical protein